MKTTIRFGKQEYTGRTRAAALNQASAYLENVEKHAMHPILREYRGWIGIVWSNLDSYCFRVCRVEDLWRESSYSGETCATSASLDEAQADMLAELVQNATPTGETEIPEWLARIAPEKVSVVRSCLAFYADYKAARAAGASDAEATAYATNDPTHQDVVTHVRKLIGGRLTKI